MTEVGSNLTQLKRDAKEAVDKVQQLKLERTECNQAIAEVRASMEAKGINKAAFDMALRYMAWEPEKREGFDLAYQIVREAISLPVAGTDLVQMAEQSKREADAGATEQDGTQ